MTPTGRNRDIRYINTEIPPFEMPIIQGSRYQAQVPDTLDLAERASHAIHGLTASTDPEANFEIYWRVCFGWKPPAMYHDWNDHVEFKYYAPSMLLRLACGSDESWEVEWQRMANLLQMQGPDGLLYTPIIGRPWGEEFGSGGESYERHVGDQMMDLAMHGRYVESAAVYHALTGDSQWEKLARRMVSALHRLAIDKGEYAFFDKHIYAPGEKAVEGPLPVPPSISHNYIWLGHGLTTCYRMTGCEEALDLAYKLARFFALGHSGFVGPDGEFRLTSSDTDVKKGSGCVHFHTNTLMRMHMLDAGIARGDKAMVELAQRGYRYARNHPESETLMGYFPENLGPMDAPFMRKSLEICDVADMIYLALRQSTEGLADCWDDVDRWVRNIFAEMQLLETGWAYEYSQHHGRPKQAPWNPRYTTSDKVPERCRGAWGGWGAPNDWQGDPMSSVMACCVGNAAMQLYRVWRDMLGWDKAKNRLSIHLLLNRASPWADIHSHIPHRGQVEVQLKRDCEVALRIPEWSTPNDCGINVNGSKRPPVWEGRYAVVEAKKGEIVTLHCPISERGETLRIVERNYKVVIRGNDIVAIDPPGTHHPLFQRTRCRQYETQWRTIERFVADEVVKSY
ncbi:MAG: glycoside hydrolase family 127 protein [Verrucomicrobia bacterium]|nr:glycoside hydrolase family 127 protein [Verrucomicrobiota bacterium]